MKTLRFGFDRDEESWVWEMVIAPRLDEDGTEHVNVAVSEFPEDEKDGAVTVIQSDFDVHNTVRIIAALKSAVEYLEADEEI